MFFFSRVCWLPALLFGCRAQPPVEPQALESTLTAEITLSGAWALYPLAVRWGDAFHALHPGVRVHVAAGGSGKGAVDALDDLVDLGMLSRDVSQVEEERGAWWVSVAADAVVVVVNQDNPVFELLRVHGASRQDLARVFLGTAPARDWALLVPGGEVHPLRTYVRSDASGADRVIAAWLGTSPDDLQGVGVYGDPGLAEVVKKDLLGLGYNNASTVYDPTTGKPAAGLTVLPLDLDDDGVIGPGETTCSSISRLAAAVQAGQYPSALVRDLRLVAHGAPTDPAVRAFLTWVLGDGQALVESAGYLPLSPEVLAAGLRRLGD